jgi:phosphate uptake regulator
VMSVAKTAPLLERIADHACNIARSAIDLAQEPELRWARSPRRCWRRRWTLSPNQTQRRLAK